MAGFRKKPVDESRVAAVQDAASTAPIVGDPRMAPELRKNEPAKTADLGSSQDVVRYEVGKLYDVPVAQIRSNPFNPRVVYTTSAVADMAASLASRGQSTAAIGFSDADGQITLIEGETRLRGARAAGLATLRIEVRPKPASDRELYEAARAANVERSDQTPLDDAIKWKDLLAKKIYQSQVALAKALGIGEDQVSRTLSLAQLPSKVIHSVAEHPDLLSLKMLNAMREFWEVRGEDETLELILEAAKAGMGYRDVVARRKAANKGPIKRPRSTREQVTFRGAQGEFKSFEEGGRIELKLKGLEPDVAEEIAAKILALFPKDQP